jgi:mono/diheme cytochrome c family protein
MLLLINNNCVARDLVTSARDQDALLSSKKTFEYYCSPCHGKGGKGDGTFFTYGLTPTPRNLADANFISKKNDADLVKAITDGSKAVQKSNLCPPWGKTLSEKKIRDLVSYIRTFSAQGAEKAAVAAKEAVVAEEKSSAAKGSIRLLFLAVIAIALAGGAISEWKKLKRESQKC